ncbi:recombinase-like helix-turn-helix domain-containing protein [Streptomyces sp. NRRL S-340]|uniref:recombinase-like helix-turn-helix domain-containing protein n=1 Tax=Streptomyces sp. NRRL S-340 TaxID=1463901 RepID=UPI00056A9DF3|nr:recombinase-like helix-turn-helix domain-containing protein [Streptomyces sp. NRRL S-340]
MTTGLTTWPCLDPHQSRGRTPTPYELKLARTLEEIFTNDGHELADVVAGLNSRQVHTPGGEPWTEDTFRAEMHRLGA